MKEEEGRRGERGGRENKKGERKVSYIVVRIGERGLRGDEGKEVGGRKRG